MFRCFIERIETSVMADERRSVLEVLGNACAAGGTVFHLEITPAKPDVKPTNTGRQRLEIDLRLRKLIHDGANELLNFFWGFHRFAPAFRKSGVGHSAKRIKAAAFRSPRFPWPVQVFPSLSR